jgi:hypothetical protein
MEDVGGVTFLQGEGGHLRVRLGIIDLENP